MRYRFMVTWFCLGVIAHDLISAYFPDGGHIPGLHAWYFALPLLILALALPRKAKPKAPPNPSAQQLKRVYA